MKWQNTVMQPKRKKNHLTRIKCSNCGEEKQRRLSRLGWKKMFCDSSCYSKWKRGKNSPLWRGGVRVDKDGYILVHNPDHPLRDRSNYVREHRLAMEKHIGRLLNKQEIVHHVNGIRKDNRIENLVLHSGHSDHQKKHYSSGGLGHLRNAPSSKL
jgi:hypothetical protein